MSYILDALNKAEKERHLGDVPTIETNHEAVRPEKKRSLVPIIVLMALILNIGLVAWLFLGKPDRAAATLPQSRVAGIPQQATTSTDVVRRDVMKQQAVVQKEVVRQAADNPVTIEKHSPVDEINRQVTRMAAITDSEQAVPEKAQKINPEPAAVDEDIPYLTEKPLAFQQAIPEINIDVHVYSDTPSKRFILINLKKYQEDDNIAKGLMLEEITPEGLVLSYDQEKFRWPMMNK